MKEAVHSPFIHRASEDSMPQHPFDVEEILRHEYTVAVLDAVCEQEGLSSREQAAEFLLRCGIRKGNARLTGRGRALYPAGRQER